MMSSYHTPVLLSNVLSLLAIEKGSWYVDGTLGGGGYSVGILRNGGNVVGIDVDPDALAFTRKRLQQELPDRTEGRDWILVHDNFRNVQKIITSMPDMQPKGMVMDLGISSHQLDQKDRGFSYRFEDAPLDLRMNQHEGIPASVIINTYSKEELYDIFTKFGEEERAWTIVNALTSTRRIKSIETIGDLIKEIKQAKGDDRTQARVFQALRIAVNDELGALEGGLQGAEQILPPGGKLVVVSFHSLEDRQVKRFFQKPRWKKISDMVQASDTEREQNSRSRSAKLRAGEKVI